MAKEVEVVVDVDVDGSVRFEVVGASGPGCKGLTAPYEKLFGDVRTERLKDEYQDVTQQTRQRAGG